MLKKFTPELLDDLCKYVSAGNSNRDSATLVGISEETFYEWQRPASEQYHPELVESLKKAEQSCKARNIAFIQKAAEKTWQAAAWWLERRYRDDFAIKQVNELQGKNGEPIPGFAFIVGNGFDPLSAARKTNAPPKGSVVGNTGAIQGVDLAQASEKNDNGNISDGDTVAT